MIVEDYHHYANVPTAIIVALPIGRIADHRVHRGVFMVIIIGILMSLTWTLVVGKYFEQVLARRLTKPPVTSPVLPIKLVWASSVCLLIGGGRYAAEMLLAAMVAKACNEETRYSPKPPEVPKSKAELAFVELAVFTTSTHASFSASS